MHYDAIRNSRGVAIIPRAGARGAAAGGGGAHACPACWLGPGPWLLLLAAAGLLLAAGLSGGP